MNSVQTKDAPKLQVVMSPYDVILPILEINVTADASINILNEADVPHTTLRSNKIEMVKEKYLFGRFQSIEILVNKQLMINDDGIQDILPEYRNCRFGYETLNGSLYKAYSYTACVNDCFREAQYKSCNCSEATFDFNTCDFKGYMCLDDLKLFRPSPAVLIPWNNEGFKCECVPSCEDHEITQVAKATEVKEKLTSNQIKISLATFPTEKYRRQLLRDQLYMVVTFGGIFGLFMGASIISLIELVYFMVTRFVWYLVKK